MAERLKRLVLPGFKLLYLLGRGITDIMDGVTVLALVEVNLERKDREHLVHVATDVLDAPLFPRPYLGRDIIIDRYGGVGTHILGYVEVEARIVDQNDHVGRPLHDVALTHLHVAQDGAQMEQHRHEAHVSQLAVVFYARAAHRRHEVAAEEAKLGIGVLLSER